MSMSDWLQIVKGLRYCLRCGIIYFTRAFGSLAPRSE
jgi:hypothetical protein